MAARARHRAPTPRRGRLLSAVAIATIVVLAGRVTAGSVETPAASAASDRSSAPTPATQRSTPATVTRVHLDVGGDVTVAMNVVLAEPGSTLTLLVPVGAGATAEFAPEVRVVAVRAGDRTIPVGTRLREGERTTVDLGARVAEVRVEYVATGTWVDSEPSTTGRGLVLLTPLTVVDSAAASRVEVRDRRILTVGCAERTRMRTCAATRGSTWTAERSVTEDVIAQVDPVVGLTPPTALP